jgi:Ca2+/Na+ antiporter
MLRPTRQDCEPREGYTQMSKLRNLAAIDIVFLGYRFVLVEYAIGVFFSAALGLFVLFRSRSFWQVVLGIYLICLGINYLPMLAYTVSIANKDSAQAELGAELSDKPAAMSKYRRQSLLLLVPLFLPLQELIRLQPRNRL